MSVEKFGKWQLTQREVNDLNTQRQSLANTITKVVSDLVLPHYRFESGDISPDTIQIILNGNQLLVGRIPFRFSVVPQIHALLSAWRVLGEMLDDANKAMDAAWGEDADDYRAYMAHHKELRGSIFPSPLPFAEWKDAEERLGKLSDEWNLKWRTNEECDDALMAQIAELEVKLGY